MSCNMDKKDLSKLINELPLPALVEFVRNMEPMELLSLYAVYPRIGETWSFRKWHINVKLVCHSYSNQAIFYCLLHDGVNKKDKYLECEVQLDAPVKTITSTKPRRGLLENSLDLKIETKDLVSLLFNIFRPTFAHFSIFFGHDADQGHPNVSNMLRFAQWFWPRIPTAQSVSIIDQGMWLSKAMMLQLKCTHGIFGDGMFGAEEVNEFLKRWQDGQHKEVVKYDFPVAEGVDPGQIMKGIKTFEWDPTKRDRKFIARLDETNHCIIDTVRCRDMVGKDGTLASVRFHRINNTDKLAFQLLVWHEPFRVDDVIEQYEQKLEKIEAFMDHLADTGDRLNAGSMLYKQREVEKVLQELRN